jgi:hypothetical protein
LTDAAPVLENRAMAVAATTTPQLRAGTGHWVSSAPWDLFWMFSALWGSALLGALALAVGVVRVHPVVVSLGLVLALFHSWSTTYVVIASPVLREARRRNRVKFTAVPIAVVVGSVGLGYAIGATGGLPSRFPLTSAQSLWALYLALFWVGHFWHFGNQDFGVLSIYRAKAGQTALRARRIDKAYAVAMMFVIQPCVYLKSVAYSPLGEAVYSFVPIPYDAVQIAAAWAAATAVGLTVAVIGYELSQRSPSVPKLAYYLVMLSHPLVLYFVHWRLATWYLVVYFWSHWLVAIGLVGRIHTNSRRLAGASPARALWQHAVRLGAWVAVAGAFYAAFGSYNLFSGGQYKEVLSAIAPGWSSVVGLILGAFLAEQLLHYYCDRCLFRFRDPDVRRAVAPLL